MKLTVKTLKASHFEIEVQPSDTIIAVKKVIEETKGKESFPCAHQLLIYNGKVLKDETTLEDNKVREDGFVVVMLSKSKILGTGGSSSSQAAAPAPAPASAPTFVPAPAPAPGPAAPAAAQPVVPDVQPRQTELQTQGVADVYGHAASTLVGGENLEPTIQQLLEMGGGSWDRETVVRALRAAYNNPERAVDYLYSGIPATAEVAVPVARVPSSPAQNLTADASRETDVAGLAPPVTGPNASPLNLFPQGTPNFGAGTGGGSLDFLRNNQQFVDLRSMIQSNPQILQPMLQELSKQNPQLLRQIQDHQAEFLQLLNEQLDEPEGDLFEQLEQDMPQSVSVTPEEQEAIARLEAMGFDRALVIEAYLACDRNEELAANYLLENAGDFED